MQLFICNLCIEGLIVDSSRTFALISLIAIRRFNDALCLALNPPLESAFLFQIGLSATRHVAALLSRGQWGKYLTIRCGQTNTLDELGLQDYLQLIVQIVPVFVGFTTEQIFLKHALVIPYTL